MSQSEDPMTVKVNPTLQEILNKDTAVHNHLLNLAEQESPDSPSYVTNQILAAGLSAIHDRLGEMWRWDKAVDPS